MKKIKKVNIKSAGKYEKQLENFKKGKQSGYLSRKIKQGLYEYSLKDDKIVGREVRLTDTFKNPKYIQKLDLKDSFTPLQANAWLRQYTNPNFLSQITGFKRFVDNYYKIVFDLRKSNKNISYLTGIGNYYREGLAGFVRKATVKGAVTRSSGFQDLEIGNSEFVRLQNIIKQYADRGERIPRRLLEDEILNMVDVATMRVEELFGQFNQIVEAGDKNYITKANDILSEEGLGNLFGY